MNILNRKPRNELMYQAILSLQNMEECEQFFEDLCSAAELQAMEQRFEVARLLNKGLIYSDIFRQTGASSAIISRVKRSLQYGSNGYSAVFSRLEKQEEQSEDPSGDPIG